MRPGLVVVGLAFAVVGAGLVTSFFFVSTNSPPQSRTSSVTISILGPNQTQVWPLSAVGSGAGELTVSWRATLNANVSFWKAAPCTMGAGLCGIPPALVAWTSNVSGSWKESGSIGTAYLLSVTDVSRGELSFNGTVVESFPGPTTSPSTQTIVLVSVGSVLLLGTGAIGVFLGLFLRGGVYQRSPVEPERPSSDTFDTGADDLDEAAGESPGGSR